MAAWTSDEISKIGATEELRLASRRRDGTLRKPVTMWVVPCGDSLYVRSVNGRTDAWCGSRVRRPPSAGKSTTLEGRRCSPCHSYDPPTTNSPTMLYMNWF
jgi:hypothetical protein